MKDLPLSTLLPIMLETAEWSSDAEEALEDVNDTLLTGQSSPPASHREGSSQEGRIDRRRSSLPGGGLRRHFNHFKIRRKTSAPCVPPHSTASTQQAQSHTNPLASMTGTPLIDLLEKLRPRQSSTTDSGMGSLPAAVTVRAPTRRRSVDVTRGSECSGLSRADEGFHSVSSDDPFWKPLFVDTKLANASVSTGPPATVPRRCVYYRQTSLVVGGAEEASFQGRRQRSNSEAGRYLIVRKCSDQSGVSEFVGRLEAEWAYCQILATMKCGDLMPPLAKLVVVDTQLTIRKAFRAMVENNVRAAPIWDSRQRSFTGLLTATDLIEMLMDCSLEQEPETAPSSEGGVKTLDEILSSTLHQRPTIRIDPKPCHGVESMRRSNQLVCVYAEDSVAKAAKLLCDRRLHRLAVVDSEKCGNVLFLMSKKDILKALQIYIAKLPLPVCMERTLDDLLIGTWGDLVTVTPQLPLNQALPLFIDRGLSALPVVNDEYQIVDMLTKVDIMNLLVDNRGPTEAVLEKTVTDATSNRTTDVEKMTTCSKKATLLLAVERLLYSDASRLAIVDSDGKLEGIVAMVDLMRFLTSGFL